MANNSPFNGYKADLGTIDTGYDKQAVDDILKASQYGYQYPCFICQQPAKYRVLAKDISHTTAQIQKGIYICAHHATIGAIDPHIYGLRELK